jgi:hypothetical protein
VAIKALCAPGRGVRHEAICDGCNEVSFPTTCLNDLPD